MTLNQADIAARLEALEAKGELLDALMLTGGQDQITGRGNQYFGGGLMRLDNTGMQLVSTDGSEINFRKQFGSSIPQLPEVYAQIGGGVTSAGPTIQLLTTKPDGSGNSSTALLDGVNDQLTLQTSSFSLNFQGTVAAGTARMWIGYSGGLVQLLLGAGTADPADVTYDSSLWYRTDIFRPRIRSNGITGNLGIEIQSATAPAIATNGTIATAGVSAARVAPAGAVTGVILAVGTTGGQMCTVINESVAANTVTFAAAGTSNVADGVASVIAGLTARTFCWDSVTSLWYPVK